MSCDFARCLLVLLLLLLLFFIFDPGTQFPRKEKITHCLRQTGYYYYSLCESTTLTTAEQVSPSQSTNLFANCRLTTAFIQCAMTAGHLTSPLTGAQ